MADQDKLRWTKLVADFETCDLTQREFAAERGISFSTLRHWIYKLRKDSRPLVTEAAISPSQASEKVSAKQGSRLVPVRVVGSATKSRTGAGASGEAESLLELVFPSGALLRFPAGTDLKYLLALAAAL